ncbi:MAG: c-type cytochrome [Parvularcula sp.]
MKDPLFGNKLAAAALTTLLLIVGLPTIIGSLTKIVSGHHEAHGTPENPFGLAYIPAEINLGGAAAAAEKKELSLAELLQNASAQRGERAAGLCGSCHTFEKGGANGIGPNLWGVVGRDIAGHAGFGYTAALQAVDGNWDYDKIDHFIANSQAYVPGTAMTQMVRKAEKRADILAFLRTLSDEPVPFPEPPPAPTMDEEATSEAGVE